MSRERKSSTRPGCIEEPAAFSEATSNDSLYAFPLVKHEPVTVDSITPELVLTEEATDYLCVICGRYPFHPVSLECCSLICCHTCARTCLEKLSKCVKCKRPSTVSGLRKSPYTLSKIHKLKVRCPNHRGQNAPNASETPEWTFVPTTTTTTTPPPSGDDNKADHAVVAVLAGCPETMVLTQGYKTLDDHMKVCEFAFVVCTTCNKSYSRKDMLRHQPDGTPFSCVNKPAYCGVCNTNIPLNEVKQHSESVPHLLKSITELNRRLTELESKFERKKATFVTFFIPKWSEIKEGTAVYSTITPAKIDNIEFWLKVEKSKDGYIGLYLCSGEERLSYSVDYQLFVRCYDPSLTSPYGSESACESVLFRTEFAKERAWGLSKFTTEEKLIEQQCYTKQLDCITFGCAVFPVKGFNEWCEHSIRKQRKPLLPLLS